MEHIFLENPLQFNFISWSYLNGRMSVSYSNFLFYQSSIQSEIERFLWEPPIPENKTSSNKNQ